MCRCVILLGVGWRRSSLFDDVCKRSLLFVVVRWCGVDWCLLLPFVVDVLVVAVCC